MGFPVLASCHCVWQGAKIGKSPRAEASRVLYSPGHATISYKNLLKGMGSQGQKMLGLRCGDFKSMITIRKVRISVPLNQGK